MNLTSRDQLVNRQWFIKSTYLLPPYSLRSQGDNKFIRSNWTVNEKKEGLTTVKQVFFSFTNGGILSGYLSLLALHLSGFPNLRTGNGPPSCQLLDNRLFTTFSHTFSLQWYILLGLDFQSLFFYYVPYIDWFLKIL